MLVGSGLVLTSFCGKVFIKTYRYLKSSDPLKDAVLGKFYKGGF